MALARFGWWIVSTGLLLLGVDSEVAPMERAALPVEKECTFEKVTPCGFIQSRQDDMNFLLRQGTTPSINTGPSFDHTLQNPLGHYIYMEASGVRSEGDVAALSTFNITGTQCVTFWYHMWGQDMGELNVHLLHDDNLGPPIWKLAGDQGNKWQQAAVPVDTHGKQGDFTVVLVAVEGKSFYSDIGLDDFQLLKGTCPLKPSTAATTGGGVYATLAPLCPKGSSKVSNSSASCSFESKCNWTQDATDDFEWTLTVGSTLTGDTGPDGDHTCSSGRYIYIETSSPRKPGDTARLTSPSLPAGTACLTFWYNMYGQGIGDLNVYQNASGIAIKVWSKSKEQGNQWKQATVNLQSAGEFQVVIEGITGSTYQGDIAVDDISIDNGVCPPAILDYCDFEGGTCGFLQSRQDNFDWSIGEGNTDTSYTGPGSDHTYHNKDGHYAFIEASRRRLGDKAIAKTFTLEPESEHCLTFFYFMHGSQEGTLSFLLEASGQGQVALWTRSGEQGKQWLKGSLSIPLATVRADLLVEAVVGGNHGDIAIDDLTLTQGACVTQ